MDLALRMLAEGATDSGSPPPLVLHAASTGAPAPHLLLAKVSEDGGIVKAGSH